MKKVFNKKNLLFLITTVCLVGLIGIGASYAYYLANFINAVKILFKKAKNIIITSLFINSLIMFSIFLIPFF